ncbi:MAG TPA: ATP12 family protein [Alteraurantiacibacter sp.]
MKRFYSEVGIEQAEGGWCVTLDERPIRTHRGAVQLVPARSLAELLAGEWRAQGEEVDPKAFVFRDIADYAIDMVAADRAAAIGATLPFAETDTLCYRADPDEPLYRRQQELWEPLIAGCERRHGVALERVSGIVHRAHSPQTLAKLRQVLEAMDDFTLAALQNLASLATSLVTGLAALEPDADAEELFTAANCEEDWQAEQWGWDVEAKKRRDARLAGFVAAATFAKAVRI